MRTPTPPLEGDFFRRELAPNGIKDVAGAQAPCYLKRSWRIGETRPKVGMLAEGSRLMPDEVDARVFTHVSFACTPLGVRP